MASFFKMNHILGLFIVFVLILLVNPKIVHNLYETVLGKLILILLILYISNSNLTLGLLLALIIIVISNKFRIESSIFKGNLLEGMDNMVKDENEDTLNDYKTNTSGVDLETIKTSIQSKSSTSIPVTKNQASTENVGPASKETFQSMFSIINN